jgi:hypothetical protein
MRAEEGVELLSPPASPWNLTLAHVASLTLRLVKVDIFFLTLSLSSLVLMMETIYVYYVNKSYESIIYSFVPFKVCGFP